MYFLSLFCSLFHVFVFSGESVDKLQHTKAVPAEPVEYQQSRGATEREMPRRFLFFTKLLAHKHDRLTEAFLNKSTWHKIFLPRCFHLSLFRHFLIYDHVSSTILLCEHDKCLLSTFTSEVTILRKLSRRLRHHHRPAHHRVLAFSTFSLQRLAWSTQRGLRFHQAAPLTCSHQQGRGIIPASCYSGALI